MLMGIVNFHNVRFRATHCNSDDNIRSEFRRGDNGRNGALVARLTGPQRGAQTDTLRLRGRHTRHLPATVARQNMTPCFDPCTRNFLQLFSLPLRIWGRKCPC